MADYVVWQHLWRQSRNLSMRWHNTMFGRVGCLYIKWQTEELKGMCSRDWKSDHPLVFTVVIFPTEENTW